MGVIQRQTLKNNAVAVAGILIGVVSQLYIYPQDLELKGLLDGLIYWAMLLIPILVFGMSVLSIRALPYMRGEKSASAGNLVGRSTLVVILVAAGAGMLLWIAGEWLTGPPVDREGKVNVLGSYGWWIFGLALAGALRSVYTAHAHNFNRIAVPAVFEYFLPKLGLPLIVLAVVYGQLTTDGAVAAQLVLYGLITLGTIGYALRLGGWQFSVRPIVTEGLSRKQMRSIALFGILATVSARLVTLTDVVMVNRLLPLEQTAIYTFALFIALIMALPAKAVGQVAAPIVAEHWRNQEIHELAKLYRQVSEVLFAIGGVLLTGIVVVTPYVYGITDKTAALAPGYQALLLLGVAQLVELMTSLNNTIVTYTDYYRWNTLFLLCLGGINIGLNYFFITRLDLGITGAALASLLSLSFYNLVKVVFLWIKLDIHPFGWPQLYTAAGLAAIGALAYFLPLPEGTWLNLLVRGTAIVLLSGVLFYFTRVSPEVRTILRRRGFLK